MIDVSSLSISELVDLEQKVFKRINDKCVEAGMYMAKQRFGNPETGNELFADLTNYFNDEGFDVEIGVREINGLDIISNTYVTIPNDILCGDYKLWYLNILEEERIRRMEQEKQDAEYYKKNRYEQYLKLKAEFENE